MKDKTITRSISQGVYVLTTNNGGCIVDAVSQISAGDNPLISVAVMKNNYTNELLHQENIFALSILSEKSNPNIIKIFGMNSMRDINKFENIETTQINNTKVIPDSIGCMILEKVDMIENDTHTLFIGKLIEGERYTNEKAMTYQYYQEHKDELIKVITEKGNTAWICSICGYIYYGDDIPADYICPRCGVNSSLFNKK